MVRPKIIYVVAAHNESKLLKNKMSLIHHAAQDLPIGGLVIIENGSSDNTLEICQQIKSEFSGFPVVIGQEPVGDLGRAWARGLEESMKSFTEEHCFYLMTAADLPFDFTDIHEFLKFYQNQPGLDVVIGSKGHPRSILDKTWLRKIMSAGFFTLRFLLLGLKVRDTQGTVFLRRGIVKQVLERTSARGFFFSTELIFRAKQQKLRIDEVPIVLRRDERKSSVKALRDSWRMLKLLVGLSLRR
jgi:glycosyltransferase involved in cell wall biosynthesis